MVDMKINKSLEVSFEIDESQYKALIFLKEDSFIVEDGSWETDVDCINMNAEKQPDGYPYLTIWGATDGKGCPTSSRLHGLLNYENYEKRIDNDMITVICCR